MSMVQSSGRAGGPIHALIWSRMLVHTPEQRRAEKTKLAAAFRASVFRLMDERGLTNPDHLARFVGVSKQTGYNWMDEESSLPEVVYLKLIAERFEVTIDALLSGRATSLGEADTPDASPGDQFAAAMGAGESEVPSQQRRRRRKAG